MKKIVLFTIAALMLAGCSNKTQKAPDDSDSTAVIDLADSVNIEQTVIRQVKDVYEYLATRRDTDPWLDERFGSKEWLRVMDAVAAVDRECECGGFFDFGDEGPVNPWTFEHYDRSVMPDSIKVQLSANGTADVSFILKETKGKKSTPLRWQMRLENDQWRVNTIIYDGNNLLMAMRAYADDGRYSKSFDIKKYLPAIIAQTAEQQSVAPNEISFESYGLLDVDRDGQPEVFLQHKDGNYSVLFSLADGSPTLLAHAWGATSIYFFEHGVGVQGGCGTGCFMSDCAILKDSKAEVRFSAIDEYGMDGELSASTYTKDGKETTADEIDKLKARLGEQLDLSAIMHEIELDDFTETPNLSEYAE